jgi:formylglycine-generating enzyme required for sulfatase activity
MPVETIIAGSVAGAVIKAVATYYLDGNVLQQAAMDVLDLARALTQDEADARKTKRVLESAGEKVEAEMRRIFATQASGLSPESVEPLALAFRDAIQLHAPTPELLRDPMLNPETIYARLREGAFAPKRKDTAPGTPAWRDFGPAEQQYLERTLRDYSIRLMSVIDTMPARPAVRELARREAECHAKLEAMVQGWVLVLEQSLSSSRNEDWQHFHEQYCSEVARELDRVELFGATLNSCRRWSLSVAYVTLGVGEAGRDAREASETSFVDQVVRAHPRLLIHGAAGSGKTTLGQWLAVRAAKQDQLEQAPELQGLVPFFIKMRRFPDGEFPAPEGFPKCAAPNYGGAVPPGWVQTQMKRAIIILDGVDELSEAAQEKARDWIIGLVETFPEARYVVTSRPYAAKDGWLKASDFAEAMLMPMREHNVATFVEQWNKAVAEGVTEDGEKAALLADAGSLVKQIVGDHSLRALATTPLLCALLCALYHETHRHLPRVRMQLYRACCEMLVDRRDRERTVTIDQDYPRLEQDAKLRLLQDAALWMVQADCRDQKWDEVLLWLEPRVAGLRGMPQGMGAGHVLRLLTHRTGVMREPAAGVVDFAHLVLRDYLAAEAFVRERHFGPLDALASRPGEGEIIALAAGIAGKRDAERIIKTLLNPPVWRRRERVRRSLLGAACLETVVELEQGLRSQVEARLADVFPLKTRSDAEMVARAGGMAMPHLRYDASAAPATLRWCTAALALMDSDGARAALLEYVPAMDRDPGLRIELLRALGGRLNGQEYVDVPGGACELGAPIGAVEIRPFQLGKYPVTVAQYREFTEVTGRRMPKPPPWGWIDNHPMVNVSWFDARDYCEWTGGRLPTEEEWEWAASWDQATRRRRAYPWGDEWDPAACANSVDTRLAGTVAVGSYASGVSRCGCYDMAGNVWEWCSNPYGRDVDDKQTGVSRVLRGGSWSYGLGVGPDYFRCAYRLDGFPVNRGGSHGFRGARTV